CDCPDLHVFIPAGGTYTAKIPFKITQEGEWSARLHAYNIPMGYEMQDCPTNIPIAFSSKFTEESPASLLLVEAPQLLTERCEVDGEIEFQLIVSNAGGKFSDRMGIRFYTGQSTNVQPAFTIGNDVDIAMSAQSDTITISGTLTEAKGMKKYYARPYYRDAYGDEQLLKLSDPAGSSSIPAAIEVRVYNASGIETITIDDAPVILHYDLFGRPVQEGKGRISISPGQKSFKK
ncbi:MAG: hypothetical protein J5543_09440, partial [Bacteroidales bacterium]|nr:hypothetical protein [Bacteroidales bacterium]